MKSQSDKKSDLLKNQAKMLMDSFDTVALFATKYNPENGSTDLFCEGKGNYFARYAQVRDWVIRQEFRLQAEAIQEAKDQRGE